jgi:hypothetical protein
MEHSLAGVRKVRCFTFHATRDAAPIIETDSSLNDVDQDDAAHILVLRYQFDSYRHRGLRACRSIRRVCSLVIRSYVSPATHCVPCVRLETRFTVASAEKCTGVCLEN